MYPCGSSVLIIEPFYRRSPASGDQWSLPYGNAVLIVETIITYYFFAIMCYTFTVIT